MVKMIRPFTSMALIVCSTIALGADVTTFSKQWAAEELPEVLRAQAAQWPSKGGRIVYHETRREAPLMSEEEYQTQFNAKMDEVDKQIGDNVWPPVLLDRWEKKAREHGVSEIFAEARRQGDFRSLPFYSEMIKVRKDVVISEYESQRILYLTPVDVEREVELRIADRKWWRQDIQTMRNNRKLEMNPSVVVNTPERSVSLYPDNKTGMIDEARDMESELWGRASANPFAYPLDVQAFQNVAKYSNAVDVVSENGAEAVRVVVALRGICAVYYFDAATLYPVKAWNVSAFGAEDKAKGLVGGGLTEWHYKDLPNGQSFTHDERRVSFEKTPVPDELAKLIAAGQATFKDIEGLMKMERQASLEWRREIVDADLDVPIEKAVFNVEIPTGWSVVDKIRGIEYDSSSQERIVEKIAREALKTDMPRTAERPLDVTTPVRVNAEPVADVVPPRKSYWTVAFAIGVAVLTLGAILVLSRRCKNSAKKT